MSMEPETCKICGQPREVIYDLGGGEYKSFPIVHRHDLPGLSGKKRLESVSYRQRLCFGKDMGAYERCCMEGLVAPQNVRAAADEFISGVEENARNSRRGMILYGSNGVGKTYLAAAIANKLIENGRKVRWVTLEPLIRMTPQQFDMAVAALRSIETDVVVIDDFAAERSTGFGIASTFQVIDELYRAHACMLVTTNLTRSQIANPGPPEAQRVLDRMKERCLCVCYEGRNKRQDALAEGRRQ